MPIDVGSQSLSLKFNVAANSKEINRRFVGIRPTGIYSGGYLTIVDSSNARISTFVAEVTDATHQMRVETTATVTLAVAEATPLIVVRWSYTGNTLDYAELLAIASGAELTTDLVVGLCTFTGGGALNGFSYADRTDPNVQNLLLKVEPSEDTELKVRIRAGRVQNGKETIQIPDQKSDLLVAPSADSKIYLVLVNRLTGVISIDSTGTEAANPSAPNYDGNLVLAEITLATGATNIVVADIEDVRDFSNMSHPVDGTSIVVNPDGELEAGYTPIVYVGGQSRTAPDGQIVKTGSLALTGSPINIVFSTPFPTECRHIQLTIEDADDSTTQAHFTNRATTGFTVAAGSLTGASVHWEAKGF